MKYHLKKKKSSFEIKFLATNSEKLEKYQDFVSKLRRASAVNALLM